MAKTNQIRKRLGLADQAELESDTTSPMESTFGQALENSAKDGSMFYPLVRCSSKQHN